MTTKSSRNLSPQNGRNQTSSKASVKASSKAPVKASSVTALLKKAGKRYLIDAMGAMVYGLFASLLIGTILKTIFGFIHIEFLQPYFQQIIYWTSAGSPLVGAAIGVAVASGLKSKPLAVYSAAVVGGMAYLMNAFDVVAGTPIK